jgi:hypothetical protein
LKSSRKKLLVSGCSWTEGTADDKIIWPEILAEKMGLELVNLGKGGAGNEYIFSAVCDSLVELDDISFVVVMWSEYFRLDFDMFRDTSVYHLHHNEIENIFSGWFQRSSAKGPTKRSIRFAYALQDLMKDIPNIQVQGLRPVHNISNKEHKFKYIKECANVIIDSPYKINKKFLYWPLMSEIGGKCMEDFLKPNELYDELLHPNAFGHPNEKGHQKIADILYKEIGKHDLYKS